MTNKNYETAEKPADEIMADIVKPKKEQKEQLFKIKMTKVFRGKIDGEYKVYLPGDEVTGKDAEHIKGNYETWCKEE